MTETRSVGDGAGDGKGRAARIARIAALTTVIIDPADGCYVAKLVGWAALPEAREISEESARAAFANYLALLSDDALEVLDLGTRVGKLDRAERERVDELLADAEVTP